jgi:hypothetical protein
VVREERGRAAGLTGERRTDDGDSRAEWGLRGFVLGRLDGVLLDSGGFPFFPVSGSGAGGSELRSSWHGEGEVRTVLGVKREGGSVQFPCSTFFSSGGDHGWWRGGGEQQPRATPWVLSGSSRWRWSGVGWCCGGRRGAGWGLI